MMRLPGPLHVVNEGLAFLLEVCALGLLCWWGFSTGGNVALHVLLGIGAPLAAAVLWGLFASPKARHGTSLPVVLTVKALVFGAAAVALVPLGHPVLAAVFAAVALVNTVLATLDREAAFHQARS
ncbi:YrdB family protein [Actinomadura macrotermitis]|uniref:DUF2568 domain-containing protein n=1 Tax=Actinomadura macrotermitis TaxID=2585200 RepID=A0A7K0BW10_9ACTN|nr:YrdB family protein [Actinomadura macrotermitis]MQY05359.1 hypothetical protein [Actinomadura macrotermitis]